MKIVILADSISSQSSGIHYYGSQLVKRLIRDFPNNEYHLIASESIPEFSEIPQTIIKLKKIPLHLRLRQIFTIPKVVKKLNPDHVIELAHFGPFGLPSKIKRTTVIHDLTPIYYPEFHGFLSNKIHRILLPKIIKNADSIIVNSACTKGDLEKFAPASMGKIKILFPELVIPSEINTSSLAQGKYLLAVGTIEPRKNYSILLEAFKAIGSNNSEIKLVIVGSMGWKMDHFNELIGKHPYKNRIIITGYVDRETLWGYYTKAFAFVFPSHFEGFGIPILEASYHGLPMLLSNIPTSKEIAEDAAIYFEPNDVKDLSLKVLSLLDNNDKLEALKKQSKERYEVLIKKAKSQLSAWHDAIS